MGNAYNWKPISSRTVTQNTNREKLLASLLKEALAWVTPKPWDDSTLLHARISKALGLEVQYPVNVQSASLQSCIERLDEPEVQDIEDNPF